MVPEWNEKETVKFRDPVHGYITVPRIYVKEIIDTPYMQRIKGVSQTGISPLYPSATHYRFAHSLGVYHFSMIAYDNLKRRILNDAKNRSMLGEKIGLLEWDLDFWKVLLSIAALLHDVGHPAFSHSFEYLYDDVFMLFFRTEYPNEIGGNFSARRINMRGKKNHQYDKWKRIAGKLSEFSRDPKKYNSKKSWLRRQLAKFFDTSVEDITGKPHERMSAYMILHDMAGSKDDSLYNCVKKVIEVYLNHNLKRTSLDRYEGISDEEKQNELIKESIRFICRMITGQKYATPYTADFDFENYCKSAKNCVINVLNGRIDADNIDYTMRNAYTAGYDTHKVDHNRLCSSFSVYFEENILNPCFASNAISVLEGFISARNTEPTWLYSHHKVVYHDILVKMLFIYSSKYLRYLDVKSRNAPSVERDVSVDRVADGAFEVRPIPEQDAIPLAFYPVCMISPLMPYVGSEYTMNGSTDASFDTLFRAISANLHSFHEKPRKYDNFYSSEDNQIFKKLLNEYSSRKHKRSLWKSYPEYLVRIKFEAKKMGIDWKLANRYMIKLFDELQVIDESNSEQPIYAFNSNNELPEEFKNDCFLNNRCVCTIVTVHCRNFSELIINFEGDGMRPKLGDFLQDTNLGVLYKFPYFFVTCPNISELKSIRDIFWSGFRRYCDQEKSKKIQSLKEDMNLGKMRGFRDVIHGDIVFPDKFWKIIETREFQRLLRIKQLALTSLIFPTVNHTRYEHSIGACHIMCQAVERFKVLGLNIDSDDSDIAILATLLHDIGHGPFSHAFESVMGVSHEEWTKRIILKSPELTEAIKDGFGEDVPQRVVDCLSSNDSVKTTSPEKLNFSFIYSALVSGALDVDRIDYLLRDAYYTATRFGNIDIPKIISAIKLTSIDGIYRLCFDEDYLPYLEQLVLARKEMYNNVYCDSRKVLMETLVEKIIQRAYKVRDKLDASDCKLLESLKMSVNMDVEDYLVLDDYTMYDCFKRWHKDNNDTILSKLTGSVLNKNLYESALDVSPQSKERSDLLREMALLLGVDLNWDELPSDTMPEESFAIFKMDKYVTIYPATEIKNKNAAKTILVSNQNGEVKDFSKYTDFNFAQISRHYLFWSKSILEDILHNKYPEQEANKMGKVDQVEKLIESYKPRNHIEIERKYLCSSKILESVESLISGELHAIKTGSFSLIEPFKEKEQIDIYFDTKDRMLFDKGCTLRIRYLEANNYICTVKLPIESESFGGNSPTARREYESAGSSGLIDPVELLQVQKNFIVKRLGSKGITEKDIVNLEPILNVKNKRKKGTIIGTNNNFKCEVCLDRVTYSSPTGAEEIPDYQIEIELKSDYLTHVILNQFTAELEKWLREEKKADDFKSTGTSKLERGLGLLANFK